MKILVVEDDQLLGKSIKKGLEQEAMVVEWVSDGQEGFDRAVSEPYDVVVLDRMLPNMSGMELCQQLRKENILTPVLMLTALGDPTHAVEGLTVGADDYMSKPFSFAELVARIRTLVRRPHNIVQTTYHIADLRFDSTVQKVTRAGIEIQLSKKEYQLLEYLIKNKGLTLSKEQIIQHVWEFDSDVLPNTVEAFIMSLRKKIEKPFPSSVKLIHTVRGFGYSLQEKKI